ncbi:hypothetical protein Q4498_12520 [Neptunomonas phycophila]|uniref:hypothetical protein n=1 Tax=Neptunomonas phycophila TaxID=1572645 RepID=UPI0026E2A8F6|nr:hypothetical protein [Neptunomonas phycophila]MDO6468942.1 hypothetical protein [Neptunomonas phycophila]
MTLADSNTLESEKKSTSGELACSHSLESYLQRIREALPTVDRTLRDHGDKTIAQYLETQNVFSATSFQPRDDLAEVVYNYAKPLLGEEVAREAASELLANPVVLTANHHGVDYFAQSVQGTLIFSLRKINGKQAKTVPVFACGNVPINNFTYPRGAILYPNGFSEKSGFHVKFPVFPSKNRRDSVCTVRAFNIGDVEAFKRKIIKSINPDFKDRVETIIDQTYSPVVNLDNYSNQSVIVNALIWERFFERTECPTKLVYLEIEKIASKLIEYDLENENSLFNMVFFEKRARDLLFSALKGKKNCWDYFKQENNKYKSSGTFFFWGVDKKGRRVPLFQRDIEGKYKLFGESDSGEELLFDIDKESIASAIKERRIIPSLFSSYLVINMARGVTGLGGYYQSDYLPEMQNKVLDVLSDIYPNENSSSIKSVKTDGYLSGMQVLTNVIEGAVFPVGPLEIMLQGMSYESYRSIENISVEESHELSMIETLFDLDLIEKDFSFVGNLCKSLKAYEVLDPIN